MIIGTHIVIASKDPEADHRFLNEVLSLPSIDAGDGYLIFKLPPAECSVHETPGTVPNHELHFLVDDVPLFARAVADLGAECSDIEDAGWGLVVRVTLPSGAPLSFYEPRHERPL